MAITSLNPVISRKAETITQRKNTGSVLTRFLNWCEAQQENRLLWLGLALTAHGCILTPITVAMVVMSGTSLTLFILALIAMGMTLVTNLAAMPTRITIPVFIMSILIDLMIIGSTFFMGIDVAKTYI